MLWITAIVFAIIWGLGLITSSTFGGGIHLLLVVSVVMVLIALRGSRGTVSGGPKKLKRRKQPSERWFG
jgi:uncharacterized protein (DUF58 family)